MTAENDSEELEALFDSIVAECTDAPGARQPAAPPAARTETAPGDMYSRIGQLTRQLYDTMRELGYDGALQKVAQKDIPDARERLAYIAEMSEQAATRTLNAVEKIQPLQDSLESEAKKLAQRWDLLYRNRLNVEEFKKLAGDTHQFVQEIPARTRKSNALLLEIMMAQDFQDLTGQVIKKVVAMAQKMEQEMLQLLVAALPAEKRAEIGSGLLDGPVINPAGRDDVATSQAQVDELLESLGF
jgi:chemotaxis protein CheZ